MRPCSRTVCAFLVMIAIAGCGGATEEDVQRMAAAIEELRPGMARIAALHAALPLPDDAREVPLTTLIPSAGLETVDLAHLEAVLDLPARPDSAPRPFLISEAFQGQHVGYLQPDPAPDFGSILNIGNRVKALSAVKHVAVFRPTSVDKGEIGGMDGKGSYVIERPARWQGWVFVYAFEDPPRLVTAFPVEARSRDQMTLVVTQGYRPNADALIDDAVFELKRDTLARLTEAR